jgi:hypothetical protein
MNTAHSRLRHDSCIAVGAVTLQHIHNIINKHVFKKTKVNKTNHQHRARQTPFESEYSAVGRVIISDEYTTATVAVPFSI